MKLLMLWNYYPENLEVFYTKYPNVQILEYSKHYETIVGANYGWPSQLAQYIASKGIDIKFVIGNDEILQKKWIAKYSKYSSFYDQDDWEKSIIYQQVKYYRPDILWISSCFNYYGKFLTSLKPYVKKIIAWIGSPFVPTVDIRGINTLLTENPETLKSFHHKFEQVIVTKPGFDVKILNLIQPQPIVYELSFIGSLTSAHKNRMQILKYLIDKSLPITLFSRLDHIQKPLIKQQITWALRTFLKERDTQDLQNRLAKLISEYQNYKAYSQLAALSKSPVFGLDMYRALACSRTTLNIHIDCAGSNSGNMRTFEATGMGTCLITEKTKNISSLFEPDHEILVYNSPEELVDIIKEINNNPALAKKIGTNGQKRTLNHYTIEHMFNSIKEAFSF